MGNPRRSNGARRNKIRQRLKSRGDPCHICGEPIDYTLPAGDPLSFEADEIVPVSRYWEGGYSTPEACALDINNIKAAHRICNQKRGNKPLCESETELPKPLSLPLSRRW